MESLRCEEGEKWGGYLEASGFPERYQSNPCWVVEAVSFDEIRLPVEMGARLTWLSSNWLRLASTSMTSGVLPPPGSGLSGLRVRIERSRHGYIYIVMSAPILFSRRAIGFTSALC